MLAMVFICKFSMAQFQQTGGNLTVFSEDGDAFYLVLNGEKQAAIKAGCTDFLSKPVSKETGLVDYDLMEEKAKRELPKMIICGASAYSRDWDYARNRKVADEIGALVLADISHPAGLIATGLLNDPLEYCHIVTSTTHKTLRGPRGGIIMMRKNFDNPFGLKWNNGNLKSMAALLDAAVFPGIQGGPLEHVIAAKAVAFGEALQPEFKQYIQQVKKNASVLGEVLISNGINSYAKEKLEKSKRNKRIFNFIQPIQEPLIDNHL